MIDFLSDIMMAADRLAEAKKVTVVSHIDADGICSEAILSVAIGRMGLPVQSVFVRQMDPTVMETIPKDDSLKVFADIGSGQQNVMNDYGLTEDDVLILDHHVSQPGEIKYHEVNALNYGHNKLAASGVAYFLARAIDPGNKDLAKIAVVGNIGDMMARADLGLTGPSREIAEDGVQYGNIKILKRDLNCFGISTRPINLCLSYIDDPYIPGITNNSSGALQLVQQVGIEPPNGSGQMPAWEDITMENKRKVILALTHQIISNGRNPERLLAETYLFPNEKVRPLRNAAEFATVLNACGRWAKPTVGSHICRGDRGPAYRDAERMLSHHRSMIRDLLQFILEKKVKELSHIQYIHVGDRFPDTIIGIGAGMALSRFNREKPILIMAEMMEDPAFIKVSMRTHEEMVQRGMDLQKALVDATSEIGGTGGGHRIAAGAYIPKELEEKFLECINHKIEEQNVRS